MKGGSQAQPPSSLWSSASAHPLTLHAKPLHTLHDNGEANVPFELLLSQVRLQAFLMHQHFKPLQPSDEIHAFKNIRFPEEGTDTVSVLAPSVLLPSPAPSTGAGNHCVR